MMPVTGLVGVMAVMVAAVVVVVLPSGVEGGNFGAGITATRCNTDPSRGQVNNPCDSLYNGVCEGSYCRCPSGQVLHPNLHTCVPGDDDLPGAQGSSDDQFDDLPFDYVPPGQSSTQRPRQPAQRIDVSDTRCNRNNDPCPTLYGGVCGGSYCTCPTGTRHHPSLARCDPDGSVRRQGGGGGHNHHDDHGDHDDHDDHDHSNDDSGSSWFSKSGLPVRGSVATVAFAVMATAVVWMM